MLSPDDNLTFDSIDLGLWGENGSTGLQQVIIMLVVDSRSFDILIDTKQLLGWDVHHNLIFQHSFVMVPLESIS